VVTRNKRKKPKKDKNVLNSGAVIYMHGTTNIFFKKKKMKNMIDN